MRRNESFHEDITKVPKHRETVEKGGREWGEVIDEGVGGRFGENIPPTRLTTV